MQTERIGSERFKWNALGFLIGETCLLPFLSYLTTTVINLYRKRYNVRNRQKKKKQTHSNYNMYNMKKLQSTAFLRSEEIIKIC